jgi:hypothetical protein
MPGIILLRSAADEKVFVLQTERFQQVCVCVCVLSVSCAKALRTLPPWQCARSQR